MVAYVGHAAKLPYRMRQPCKQGSVRRAYADKDLATSRNRVSFLSRFIGSNKKKGSVESYNDAESEIGDGPRAEGMDAQVFSQPVENLGFVPKHAQPPGYIKVRSKFKKEKEFNHVFLAQELRKSKVQEADGEQPPKSPSISGPPGTSRTPSDPIWALEFSKDGKYLAAAGLEKVVRVWAVISTPEDRRAHEKTEEAAKGASGAPAVHLNAPVFQKQAVREYEGHTSTVLDLSWSKVRGCWTRDDSKAYVYRTTSFSRHRWIRPSVCGMSVAPSACAPSSTQTSYRQYSFTHATTDFSSQDLSIVSCDFGVYPTKVSHFGRRFRT